MLPCLRSGNSLLYSERDAFTARCRLSKELFRKHRANIGWIFHFKVRVLISNGDEEEYEIFEVLCTAWPKLNDMNNEDNLVFLDDSVTKDMSMSWCDGECQVLKVHPPSPCHTVRCLLPSSQSTAADDKKIGLVSSMFGGFPVAYDFQVASKPFVAFKSVAERFTVKGLSGQYGVIDVMTFLMEANDVSKDSNEIDDKSSNDTRTSSSVSRPRASCTGVVHTIIRNCIFPSVLIPAKQLHTSGILLTGPPGVGKTYAITAVKEICKEMCDIRVHNLCIPDILAHPDPVSFVQDVLKSASSAPLSVHPGSTVIATTSSSSFSSHGSSSASSARQQGGALGLQTPQKGAPGTPQSPAGRAAHTSTPPPAGQGFSWLTPSPKKASTPSSSSSSSSSALPRHSFSTHRTTPAAGTPSQLPTSASYRPPQVVTVHVVMLDEIDALGGGGEVNATNELQHAIKHLLCSWMDSHALALAQHHNASSMDRGRPLLSSPTIVIGTSNRPGDVDPCFCRGGRLEKEIDISDSSVSDREQILRGLLVTALPALLGVTSREGVIGQAASTAGSARSVLEEDSMQKLLDLLSKDIALSTGGYVAADLSSLVAEVVQVSQATSIPSPPIDSNDQAGSGLASGSVHPSSLDRVKAMIMSATQTAKKTVAPSCLRGATIDLPSLTFDDVIGYTEVKKNLSRVLSFSSVESRAKLIKFGQNTMLGGVLLYGPPGNSKTRLVQAAAAVHGLPMISLSSADVYSAYVGDSEAEIRRVFNLARQSHPCVLFMDEIDALVTNRQEESSSNNVESRVLSTLLNEMDGIDGGGNGVFVIAATNRIDFIDSALLRKGRFHHLLHVPLPNLDEKQQLLRYFATRFGINDAAVNMILPKLSNEHVSGADVENLCREAGMARIRDVIVAQSQINLPIPR